MKIKIAARIRIFRIVLTLSSLCLLLGAIMILGFETDNVKATLKASTDNYEV